MAVISPPIDFTDRDYLDSEFGQVSINPVAPISWQPATHTLGIANASAAGPGVVTTGAQTFAGRKQFAALAACTVAPVDGADLANKAYVDTMAIGLSWKTPVIAFIDMSTSAPGAPADGDRYVATTTAGAFDAENIYQWTAATSVWTEIVPQEGDAMYCASDVAPHANTTVSFNGTTWIGLGSTINHSALIGAGTTSHTTIDSRLGQAVNTTSSPSFATLALTTATASTTTGTGALVVAGGAGIGGDVCCACVRANNPFQVRERSFVFADNNAAYGFDGIGRGNGFFCFNLRYGTTVARYDWFIADDGNETRTLMMRLNYAGQLSLPATTASTTTTNGVLVVSGGAGIAGNINAGGIIKTASTVVSDSTTNGALVVAGGIGCAGAINAGGAIKSDGEVGWYATANTSRVKVGSYANFGPLSGYPGLSMQSIRLADNVVQQYDIFINTNTGDLLFSDATAPATRLTITKAGATVAAGALQTSATTASNSTTTGALIVAGGAGIAGAINAGGAISGLTLAASGATTPHITAVNAALADAAYVHMSIGKSLANDECARITYRHKDTAGLALQYLSLGIMNKESLRLRGDLVTQMLGAARVDSTTASTSSITGALIVAGGIGCAGNLYVGGNLAVTGSLTYGSFNTTGVISTTNTTASESKTTGALIVAGGAGIGGEIWAGDCIHAARSGGYAQLKVQNADEVLSFYVATISDLVGIAAISFTSAGSAPIIKIGSNAAGTGVFSDVAFPNTAAATSKTAAPVTFGGGIGVAGSTYSNKVFVSLAPGSANEVVRLAEITATTFELDGRWAETHAPDSDDSILSLRKLLGIVTITVKGGHWSKTIAGTGKVTLARFEPDNADNEQLLPTAYIPAGNLALPIRLSNNGTQCAGTLWLFTSGVIAITRVDGSAFTDTGVAVIYAFSVSYAN